MTYGKSGKYAGISAAVFILLQLVLFPLIQLTPGGVSGNMSYLSIILVVMFALFACKCRKEEHFVRLGLLLTLLADYFLIIADDAQLEGVVVFIFVQLAYFFYIFLRERSLLVCCLNVFVRIVLSAVLAAAACALLGDGADTLSLVSVIYYANLLSNIVFAFLLGSGDRLFAIGLTLFALCDLFIGLQVLTSSYIESNIFEFFYSDNLNLPWVFYQPSQVLIAISLFKKRKKRKHFGYKTDLFPLFS